MVAQNRPALRQFIMPSRICNLIPTFSVLPRRRRPGVCGFSKGPARASLPTARWALDCGHDTDIGASLDSASGQLAFFRLNAPSVAGLEKFAKVLLAAVVELFTFSRPSRPPGNRPAKSPRQE